MEVIVVAKTSEDENVDVDNSYEEGDLEYLAMLETSNIPAVESIQDSYDVDDDDDDSAPSALKKYLDGLRAIDLEKSLQTAKIEECLIPEDDISPAAFPITDPLLLVYEDLQRTKCFQCPRTTKSPCKSWKKCRNAGCRKYLCGRCRCKLQNIMVGSCCLCCGRRYIRGPNKKKCVKCLKCGYWSCRSCLKGKCRCILRSRLSHHKF